uniref:rRNA-processing protein EBP2 n=2 Tax=Peronospora matthiolae TaxID=2874970 RepID=A0AAV1U0K5_9STRA
MYDQCVPRPTSACFRFFIQSLVVHTTNSRNGYRPRSSLVNHVTNARDQPSDVAFVLANQFALKSPLRSSSPSSELLLTRDGPEEQQHSPRRSISALVRAEDAAEEEILETPALSSIAVADRGYKSESDDDVNDSDTVEAEGAIERRLVAEAQAEAATVLSTLKSENKRVYNIEALLALVQEWDVKPLPWIETLETCTAPLELENLNDDLKREVAFYTNSIAMVRVAKDRLKQDGVAYKRQDDYFAEMLKRGAHMDKVKDKLIHEQKKITAVEERKKSQAHRKVAKEVQAEKVKERNMQKKETLLKLGLKDGDDGELDSTIVSGKRKHTGGDRDKGSKKPRTNKTREAKDARFGFGGKRRHGKSNTKESTNDILGFSGARKGIRTNGQSPPKGGKRASKN